MAVRTYETLVASVVSEALLEAPAPVSHAYVDSNGNAATRSFQAAKISKVEVTNMTGTGIVFFTVNGDEPGIDGDDTFFLPAAISSKIVSVPGDGSEVTIKLISEGTDQIGLASV
jgi:hypothetical protein